MRTKRILLACSPKSGSTFLSRFLSEYFSVPLINLVPAHGYRNQEIDCTLIPPSGGFVAQNHIAYSEFTNHITATYEIETLVLTRNIFDSIFSLREHFFTESHIGPLVHLSTNFHSLSIDDQFDLLMFYAAPWYLNFFSSWANNNYRIFLYEHIFSSSDQSLIKGLKVLLSNVDPEVEHSEYLISIALGKVGSSFNRLNIGMTGRGVGLIKKYKDQLERAASLLAPAVNFSDIGLFSDAESGDGVLDYEITFLRSRQEKLLSEVSVLRGMIIEKQSFIDAQRSYIDKLMVLKCQN